MDVHDRHREHGPPRERGEPAAQPAEYAPGATSDDVVAPVDRFKQWGDVRFGPRRGSRGRQYEREDVPGDAFSQRRRRSSFARPHDHGVASPPERRKGGLDRTHDLCRDPFVFSRDHDDPHARAGHRVALRVPGKRVEPVVLGFRHPHSE